MEGKSNSTSQGEGCSRPPAQRLGPASARVVPWVAFVVILAGSVAAWATLRSASAESRRDELGLFADQLSRRLEDTVATRIALLRVVRDERDAGALLDEASFVSRAGSLIAEFGGVHAINWIDRGGVIRWVSPRDENAAAVGRNVLEHPTAGPTARAAMETGELQLTSPLELFQGGRAVTTYLPEYSSDGKLTGIINGIFRIDPLVRSCVSDDLERRFWVRIADKGELVYTSLLAPPGEHREAWSRASLSVGGRTWDFMMGPREPMSWGASFGSHGWFLGLGVLIAILVATALALVFKNLEQARSVERASLELEAHLQRSRKLESLGKLAGGIAHDFNNILTSILGNAELALVAPGLQGKHRRAMEQVLLAADRASDLTRRLLSFARQRAVETRPLNLNAEVRELRPMLERLVRADIHLIFECGAEHDLIEVSPGLVDQVLLNLVLNAVDAMPSGGELTVETRSISTDDGGSVTLVVKDTGTGMDAETRAQALDPFFTTKPVGEGTGLGLSTVFGEVRAAGGELTIHSEPHQGTTVEVSLPLAEPLPTPEPSSADERETGPGEGVTVLLVEDDVTVRSIARSALERGGHHCLEAADGLEALSLVDAGATIQVVVTDAVMPHMGGVELIRQLHQREPELPAVLMSGYSRDALTELQGLGEFSFLAKPFQVAELLEAVVTAVLGRTPESAEL